MIKNKEDSVLIATCCVESMKKCNNLKRKNLLLQLINSLDNKADLLLLPAGFFKQENDIEHFEYLFTNEIEDELNRYDSNMIVCLGFDGGSKSDQIGFAVSKNGIIGAGRKFYPTEGEDGFIRLAENYLSKEIGIERIFNIRNKKFYIAICYDGLGIRKKKLSNPGVDSILNLVHGFNPKGEGNSGDVYFAKHSFAGSSKQWGCPTFGAAVFEKRVISPNWPTGVLWDQGDKSTNNWKYDDNAISPESEEYISGKFEKALVRIFSL
jgi:hypothetical protein